MAYKVPKFTVNASKELCRSIVKGCGGPSALANSLGLDRQYVGKYMKAGYIPLVQVYDFSKLLNVSIWALSYYKLMEVMGESSPLLEDVIKDTPLLPAEKTRLLKIIL